MSDLAKRKARYARRDAKRKGDRHKGKRKNSGHLHPSKFVSAQFICFDGEGKNVGPVLTLKNEDTVRFHIYDRIQLFCDGQNFELEAAARALRTHEILDKCAEIYGKFPRATAMVGFSLGYDFTHILHDLTIEQFMELRACAQTRGRSKRCFKYYVKGKLYLLEYQERKCLSCRIYNDGRFCEQCGDGGWKIRKADAYFKLWDVWGFFQGTFIKAIEEWLGKDYPNLPLIVRMKALRGEFDKCDPAEIARYNLAEVEALGLIMTKLHEALCHPDVDLVLKRWDGAGAVAAAILNKHGIKHHLQDTQTLHPDVFEAACFAYAGGRIEMGEIGYQETRISHADIRSAYPAAMCELPSLASGRWQHGTTAQVPTGFTLVRLQFLFPRGHKYYPLFWRDRHGAIAFPQFGEGWYWFPEYEAAVAFDTRYGTDGISVLEWWHWRPDDISERPFAQFVRPMYERRAELKASGIETERAAQIVLKLGLNSLYGKLVQQLGADISEDGTLNKKPPYFQIEFAGYITSYTRAKLFTANMGSLESVISFATDGCYSHEKGDIQEGIDLGLWEHEWIDGMLAVAAGVYSQITGTRIKSHTRGYSAEGAEAEIPLICEAWRRQETTYRLARRLQMVTMNQGRVSPDLWDYRGCFREQERELRIDGYNSKREAVDLSKVHPDRRLVRTPVRETLGGMSARYKLGWKHHRELEGIDRSEDDYG